MKSCFYSPTSSPSYHAHSSRFCNIIISLNPLPPPQTRLPHLQGFGWPLLQSAFFKFVQDVLAFVSPLLLKQMICFTKYEDIDVYYGYLYAVLLLVVAIVQSIFLHQVCDHGMSFAVCLVYMCIMGCGWLCVWCICTCECRVCRCTNTSILGIFYVRVCTHTCPP